MKTELKYHHQIDKIQKFDKHFVVKAVDTQAFSHITGRTQNGPTPREQNLVRLNEIT